MGRAIIVAMALATTAPTPALASEAKRSGFGALLNGRSVKVMTLTSRHGLSARVIARGATLQLLRMPDRAGRVADVQVGYDTLDGYLAKPEFFGAMVALRWFTLDGKSHAAAVSNGLDSPHAGTRGFDNVVRQVVNTNNGLTTSDTFRYVNPDSDMDYFDTLATTATYSLGEPDALTIEYRAAIDKPTYANISNHANRPPAGPGMGAMGHGVTIPVGRYTPTDATT